MNTGWVGGDSVLLKTTNSGVNWIFLPLPVQIKIRSMYFKSEYEGYLLGDRNINGYESHLYLLRTSNSGNSWEIINYYYPAIFGTAYSSDLCILSDSVILKTYSVFHSYSSSGSILKSTNGGLNFNSVLNFGEMNGVSFIDLNTGWITSTQSFSSPISGVFKIFKTTNQGSNWFPIFTDSQPTSSGILGKAIKFFNSSSGYVLAYSNTTLLMKTTNGGLNWQITQLNNLNNRTMYFSDWNTGWIAGYPSAGSSNIKKTINGGINWIQQNVNGTEIINKLYFLNNIIGWAVGYNGVILKTTNGGSSFIKNISNKVPENFLLEQNYPNPFNQSTIINFHCPENTNIQIKIFDLLGREIATIVNELFQPGIYTMKFDARNFTSGIYFYKLITERYTETRSMIIVK